MNELGVEDQLGIFNTRSPGGEFNNFVIGSESKTFQLSANIHYYRRVP